MTNNTRAIAALIEIMGNEVASMRRRIEAAGALLSYEAPEEVVEQTKQFLAAVFEDREQVALDDRLDASRLMRKAEARKITQQTIRTVAPDKDREMRREVEIAERRLRLVEAGLWETASPDWADDLLSSDYEPRDWRSLLDESARLAHMRKVSAKNS
jgi:hypothetical protein